MQQSKGGLTSFHLTRKIALWIVSSGTSFTCAITSEYTAVYCLSSLAGIGVLGSNTWFARLSAVVSSYMEKILKFNSVNEYHVVTQSPIMMLYLKEPSYIIEEILTHYIPYNWKHR